MNTIADQYADRGVSSIFIYTREAHPAENYGHHTDMETKAANARALRDIGGVTRPILLDSLDGACHTAYGLLPNMSFIVSRRGVITYKAAWTSPPDIADALEAQLSERERISGTRVPFYTERLAVRGVDRDAFMAGLRRAGPKAVEDFG